MTKDTREIGIFKNMTNDLGENVKNTSQFNFQLKIKWLRCDSNPRPLYSYKGNSIVSFQKDEYALD